MQHPLPGFPTPDGGEFGASRARYGLRAHTGHDWTAPSGTPVVAAEGGRVVHSRTWDGPHWANGHHIHIEHGGGLETRYNHLISREVEEGEFVRAGQVIGGVGASGIATGAHLHFEVLVGGE